MQQRLVQTKRLLLAKVDIIHLKTFKARFLNFGTLDILDQITICWGSVRGKGCLVHGRVFTSTLGLHPLDASSTHTPAVARK